MKGGTKMVQNGDSKSFCVVVIVAAIVIGAGAVFSAVDHFENIPHLLFCMVWVVAATAAILVAGVALVRGK